MQVKMNYTFTTILETVRFNLISTAVFLPHHIIIELPKGRLRVSGLINGAPFSLAIQYRKDGSRYFSVGAALRKSAQIAAGDTVNVSFKILDLQHVEFPDSLERALGKEVERKQVRSTISNGTKKILSDYIREVKNLDSRIRRSVETVQKSKSGLLQPQQNRKNKNK